MLFVFTLFTILYGYLKRAKQHNFINLEYYISGYFYSYAKQELEVLDGCPHTLRATENLWRGYRGFVMPLDQVVFVMFF